MLPSATGLPTPDTSPPHGRDATMTAVNGWTYRAMWPIEDPLMSYEQAVNQASPLFDAMAAADGVRLLGWPHWSVQETDDLPGWRATPTVVVAEAAAEPVDDRWTLRKAA